MAICKLMSVNADSKTKKGVKYGYLTGILYLAPASSSGFNVCVNASKACIAACLNFAGRSRFDRKIQVARVRKTRELFADREAFVELLARDVQAVIRAAKRKRLSPAIRVNGTSDLPWLALALSARFPSVQFYDYTKHPRAYERIRANYSLTFSWSGENLSECVDALSHGLNVAVPFNVKKGQPLPASWNGYRVVDGDISDLRFLDETGVIVGLRVKSVNSKRKAQGIAGNFVVNILPAIAA